MAEPGQAQGRTEGPAPAQLEDVSTTVAGQLVTVPVGPQVNNVRTLDRTDRSLNAPLEAG